MGCVVVSLREAAVPDPAKLAARLKTEWRHRKFPFLPPHYAEQMGLLAEAVELVAETLCWEDCCKQTPGRVWLRRVEAVIGESDE